MTLKPPNERPRNPRHQYSFRASMVLCSENLMAKITALRARQIRCGDRGSGNAPLGWHALLFLAARNPLGGVRPGAS